MPNSNVPTEHWVLTDGLASVSIYIEQIPEGESAFQCVSSMGATNAFGMSKEGELNQAYQITQATIAQLRREVEADGSQFGVGDCENARRLP